MGASASESRLPAVFTVGAGVGMVRGGGRLTIDRGAVTLEPGTLTSRLSGVGRIAHTDDAVFVLKARLVPPWFNTSVLVHEGESSAHVVVPLWLRRRLLETLKAAGFRPTEVSTWFRLSGLKHLPP